MNRRMLFRIGVTLIVGIGIILFYLVHMQDVDHEREYKAVLDSSADMRKMFVDTIHSHNVKTEEDSLQFPVHDTYHQGVENEETGFIDLQGKNNNSKSSFSAFEKQQENKKEEHNLNFVGKGLDPLFQSLKQPVGYAIHLCVVVCGDRGEETMVMLKSAALVTPFGHPLVFHIITEPDHHQFFRDQLDIWPVVYRQKVAYKIYNVTFPGGSSSNAWKKLFKPCASQRLFIPDLLQSLDSLLYVDTDTLFLRSLVDLWSFFSRFNETQLAGLVGEAEDGTAGWYNRFANHPYYGQFGVNSGVMLMNLTRLRQTSWLSDMQTFYKQYRLMIPWGDQDLINIFFAYHPDQLYLMPCHWNYRSDHCKYMSNCKAAEQEGVSVLHGSRRMFYEDKEPAFASVFNTFKNYRLGDDLQFHFLEVLKEALKSSQVTNCGKVSYVFLLQLQKLLDRNREVENFMAQGSLNVEFEGQSQRDSNEPGSLLGKRQPHNVQMNTAKYKAATAEHRIHIAGGKMAILTFDRKVRRKDSQSMEDIYLDDQTI